MKIRKPGAVLAAIVIAEFLCVSPWFAANGVMPSLMADFDLRLSALGHLTTAIQLGFIGGTLCFALLRIPDRFPPSRVFLISATTGALVNLCMTWPGNTFASLFLLRFLTGFSLGGIYPVGMKIASDYFEKGLGKALGFLVGALVVGTALPHLLNYAGAHAAWRNVIYWISGLTVLGGLLIGLFVGDGPYRKPGMQMRWNAAFKIFRPLAFRKAAFGYFGHMWELYAFWAFVPLFLTAYLQVHPVPGFNVSVVAFTIIAIGGMACVLNGFISLRKGPEWAAAVAIAASGICCLISPLIFGLPWTAVFLIFLLFWGMAVIADSPMFSTLIAREALPESRGTALTLVNCIGFSITICSIQLLNWLSREVAIQSVFLYLAPGPLLGLWAMFRKVNKMQPDAGTAS